VDSARRAAHIQFNFNHTSTLDSRKTARQGYIKSYETDETRRKQTKHISILSEKTADLTRSSQLTNLPATRIQGVHPVGIFLLEKPLDPLTGSTAWQLRRAHPGDNPLVARFAHAVVRFEHLALRTLEARGHSEGSSSFVGPFESREGALVVDMDEPGMKSQQFAGRQDQLHGVHERRPEDVCPMDERANEGGCLGRKEPASSEREYVLESITGI
jgi:hypothetical protein